MGHKLPELAIPAVLIQKTLTTCRFGVSPFSYWETLLTNFLYLLVNIEIRYYIICITNDIISKEKKTYIKRSRYFSRVESDTELCVDVKRQDLWCWGIMSHGWCPLLVFQVAKLQLFYLFSSLLKDLTVSLLHQNHQKR